MSLAFKTKLKLITILLSFLMLSGVVVAQNSVELAVSPAIIELSGDPGQEISSKVILFNRSLTPLPLIVRAATLDPLPEEIFLRGSEAFDSSKWIEIENTELIVEKNSQIETVFKVKIPANADAGTHSATVIHEQAVSNELASKGALLLPSLTTVVLINVSGDLNESLQTVGGLDFSRIEFNNAINGKVQFENNGNVHLFPTTKIVARNLLTNSSSIQYVPPLTVLPKSQKRINFEAARLLPGVYGISAEITFGSSGEVISLQETKVIVLPSAGLTALVIFLGYWTILIVRKRANLHSAAKVLAGLEDAPNNTISNQTTPEQKLKRSIKRSKPKTKPKKTKNVQKS